MNPKSRRDFRSPRWARRGEELAGSGGGCQPRRRHDGGASAVRFAAMA